MPPKNICACSNYCCNARSKGKINKGFTEKELQQIKNK